MSYEPGFPLPEPSQSYWQQPPDSISDLRNTSDLPKDADVVIVGSGISAAGIAYRLLRERPGLNVVMLEARQAASGASGRNGGHTKTASYRSFLENLEAVGEEEAIKIAKLEYNCMAAVHAFIKEHGIMCDAKRCDTVDIFYDQGHLDEARRAVQKMQELIGDSHPTSKHVFHSPDQTRKLFFAENSLGSIQYEAGSLSAYKLTIAVLRLAIDAGLNLQTNTAARSLSKVSGIGKTWSVQTDRGPIVTDCLVLATNGYTASLLPELHDMVVPFRGVVSAQRPGSAIPHKADFQTTYSFIYKEGYEYMITRPAIKSSDDEMMSQSTGFSETASSDSEYDIVIGGGLTKTPNQGSSEFHTVDDSADSIPESISNYLHHCTSDFYGSNWGADNPLGTVRKVWSGIMGYSADGHPLVGPYPGKDGLWLDVSFQGHGMVLCWLCAEAISQMILKTDDKSQLDQWFPASFRVSKERLSKKFSGRIIGREIKEAESVNGQSGIVQ